MDRVRRALAEGIETTVQRRRLAQLGCEHAQGYLFAKPLTAAAAGTLIEQVRSGWAPWSLGTNGLPEPVTA